MCVVSRPDTLSCILGTRSHYTSLQELTIDTFRAALIALTNFTSQHNTLPNARRSRCDYGSRSTCAPADALAFLLTRAPESCTARQVAGATGYGEMPVAVASNPLRERGSFAPPGFGPINTMPL